MIHANERVRHNEVKTMQTYITAAKNSLAKIQNELYMSDRRILREFANSDFPAYLWPFSVFIEAVSACVDADIADDKTMAFYKTCIDEILPKYKDARTDNRVYNSTTDGGDPFYDDDAWIVLEYVRAAEVFPEKAAEYLKLAEETAEYCFSGEDEKLGGGIYWKEHKCNTKHTCINAPAIILACELYNVTKKDFYLKKAISLYDFTKKYLLDTDDGVYFDNVNADTAKVDKAKYTYNSGTMIVSGVMLYEITGEKQYLADALFTAEGAYNHFGKLGDDGEYTFKSDHSWFNSWLLRGYEALAKSCADLDKKYFASFYSAIDTCVKELRPDGFFYKKWRKSEEKDKIELIQQSGTLKCIAILISASAQKHAK